MNDRIVSYRVPLSDSFASTACTSSCGSSRTRPDAASASSRHRSFAADNSSAGGWSMPFGGDSAPVVIAPTYCSAVAVQSGPGHGSLPPCRWAFPHASTSDGAGLVGIGADLEPQTLIAAYTRGMFPMPHRPEGRIAWWSPPERCVLELDDLVVHRSLRRSCRRFEITVNQAFAAVVHGCADPNRPPRLDRLADQCGLRTPS